MEQISMIGLDLAKRVFQVHGVDAQGSPVIRRQLRRGQVLGFFAGLSPCLVGIEACASAHHWARELAALGHEVRLIPPIEVKRFVKRGRKNDANDAAAICTALASRQVGFVPVKTTAQQAGLMLHRTRRLLVGQRTMLANALRSHLAEFGIIEAQGAAGLARLIALADAETPALPPPARAALAMLAAQLADADARIGALDREIHAWHRADAASRRLATIPGIGPLTASAIVASVGDAGRFRTGRDFAAWLGLVPSQNSTGGKTVLGRITKMGDRYIRALLVMGATAMLRRRNAAYGAWLTALLARKPARLASIALANKMARIAWAVMARGEIYRQPQAA
jgi:transposase